MNSGTCESYATTNLDRKTAEINSANKEFFLKTQKFQLNKTYIEILVEWCTLVYQTIITEEVRSRFLEFCPAREPSLVDDFLGQGKTQSQSNN